MVRGSNPGGDEIFLAFQTGLEDNPISCATGTRNFPEVKLPERGADHPSHSAVLWMVWAYVSAFPMCRHLQVMGRFLPLHKITNISGSLEPTFKRCCVLGSNWAAEDLKCNNFPAPVAGVAPEQQSVCLSAVEICCLRKHRWVRFEVLATVIVV
jgi:hypothetical protein